MSQVRHSSSAYWAALDHFAAIRVHGSKATQFLQGQLTCDMQIIKNNHGSLGACCDPKGRMIANFFVVPLQEDYLLLLPQPMVEITIHHLKKYAVLSRVELIFTPEWKILEYRSETKYEGKDIFSFSFPGTSHWMIVPAEREKEIISLLTAETTITPLSFNDWENLNVVSGMAWLYPKTSGLFTPQMIDWQKWQGVSFTKGCYTGQEIIARTEHLGQLKRHLYRSTISHTTAPQIGNAIKKADGQTIGIIVGVASTLLAKEYALLAVIQDVALNDEANPVLYLQTSATEADFIADASAEIKSHHGWTRCS